MSEVENNTKIKAVASSLQVAQLEKLEQDLHGKLQERKQSLSQTGVVHDITTDTQVQTIQKALSQVQEARSQIDPRVHDYLTRAGKPTSLEHSDHRVISGDSVNAREAAQIKAIRAVSGMELSQGQQFTSLQGKEPSYNSYMKKNIEGLFALAALRA